MRKKRKTKNSVLQKRKPKKNQKLVSPSKLLPVNINNVVMQIKPAGIALIGYIPLNNNGHVVKTGHGLS